MAFNRTTVKTVTPTVTAGAYSIGDVIGGLLTFAIGGSNDGGNVARLLMFDGANQKKGMKAYIFNEEPTAIDDNDAFALSAADFEKLVGTIDLESGDYTTVGSDAFGEKGAQAVPFKTADGNLYVYLVAVEAPTFGSTSDVKLTLGIWKD